MSGRGRTLWAVGLVAVVLAIVALMRACREESPGTPEQPRNPLAVEPGRPEPSPRRAPPERTPTQENPEVAGPAGPSSVDPAEAEPREPLTDQEPKEPHTLIVRASDDDGMAAGDADVQVWVNLPWGSGFGASGGDGSLWTPGESKPVWTGTTDAAGVARIAIHKVQDVQVRVACDEAMAFVDRTALSDGDVTELVVTVGPAFRLNGVVQRPDGQTVAGATVYLAWLKEPNAPVIISTVGSDENERFEFPPAAVPDAPTLRVYAMGPSEPGAWVDLPVRRGRIENVVVTAEAATFVTGRCVDEEGGPLAHVRVRGIFPGTGEITFTNRQGRFTMKVPASGGGLVFWIKGRVQSGLRDLRGTDGKLDVGDVLIPKDGVLAGRVVRVGGRPAEGAQLIITDPVTWHAALNTPLGADGVFRSDLIGPGDHTVLVRNGGDYREDGLTCWFAFRGYFAGATGIEITLPEGLWRRVRVFDDAGEPVSLRDAMLDVRAMGDPRHFIHNHQLRETTSGEFGLQLPAPGRYQVTLHLRAEGRVVETELTASADSDEVLEIRTP